MAQIDAQKKKGTKIVSNCSSLSKKTASWLGKKAQVKALG